MQSWSININSKTPLYIQIKECIRQSILNNELVIGSKLSQRKVADIFKVSRMPVVEAFDILEAEGLIENRPQSGSVVTKNIWLGLGSSHPSSWQDYITSGSYRGVPEQVSQIIKKIDDPCSLKLNSDQVTKSFAPDILLAEAMRKVANRLEAGLDVGYVDCTGLPSLKTTIIKHLKRINIDATEDNLMLMTGVGESIVRIASAFLSSSMNFFYDRPSRMNSMLFIRSTGINMEGISMDKDGMELEPFISKIKRKKDSILYTQMICHDPTGVTTTAERQKNILSVCSQYNVPIIENDIHRDFYLDKPYPMPLKAIDTNGQVIYIGSIWNGFMGLKTAWIVAPKFIIERLKQVKRHTEVPFNTVTEIITDEMISSGMYYEYLENIRPIALAQYYRIEELLEKYMSDIVSWRRSYPSLFIWLTLDDKIDMNTLNDIEKDCLFLPGNIFDWKDTNHIRLNIVGTEPDILEEWILRLSKLLRKGMRKNKVIK